jgi:hypothetical protein
MLATLWMPISHSVDQGILLDLLEHLVCGEEVFHLGF